jgi:hypothetical protein
MHTEKTASSDAVFFGEGRGKKLSARLRKLACTETFFTYNSDNFEDAP